VRKIIRADLFHFLHPPNLQTHVSLDCTHCTFLRIQARHHSSVLVASSSFKSASLQRIWRNVTWPWCDWLCIRRGRRSADDSIVLKRCFFCGKLTKEEICQPLRGVHQFPTAIRC